MKNIAQAALLSATLLVTVPVMSAPAAREQERETPMEQAGGRTTEYATLGAGCFWCVEAVFQRIKGVVAVIPGYSGGDEPDPTYKEVCSGETGHAEVARIEYDPAVVSFEEILLVFWKSHDPTTLNRQGADVGPQYRSVIFYHDENQKEIAERSKQQADRSGVFDAPVITEISPLKTFHAAEDYHQDYFDQNPNAPYCQYVIRPKLEKLGLH